MKAIIATNREGVIGLKGKLPWHSISDMEHFKRLTANQNILVGYNTHKTLPELKNRPIFIDNDLIDVNKIDWCIGGKKTYEKYCHLFTELHISIIDDHTIGDTFFPDLTNLNPKCKLFFYNFETTGKELHIDIASENGDFSVTTFWTIKKNTPIIHKPTDWYGEINHPEKSFDDLARQLGKCKDAKNIQFYQAPMFHSSHQKPTSFDWVIQLGKYKLDGYLY